MVVVVSYESRARLFGGTPARPVASRRSLVAGRRRSKALQVVGDPPPLQVDARGLGVGGVVTRVRIRP